MPSLQYNGPSLLGSLNQPSEQTGVERSVRDALGSPKLHAGLRRQTERARSTVADEEEAVTAPVPLKPTEIIGDFGLTSLRFDLHPRRLVRCRLCEDEVNVRLVLSQGTAALPAASGEYQVDQRFEVPPVELLDHAQANLAHLGSKGDGMCMQGVSFAADAAQQIIGVLDGANRHLVAGGAGQSRTETARVQRLAVQACLGPACSGSTIARGCTEIFPVQLENGPTGKSPPKVTMGHRHPEGIIGQSVEFF